MKIALTGGSGRIGRAITTLALQQGHSIVSVDRVEPAEDLVQPGVRHITSDVDNYEGLVEAFAGCDALIHMAAIPAPMHFADHVIHNNNVVGSYNAMRAGIENGIRRICQASSVNAIGHAFSREPRYDYFPIDESHPNYSEEPYSLSKWICEQQADAFVRRYEDLSIASLRFHWAVDNLEFAGNSYQDVNRKFPNHLGAYTRFDAAADACLRSVDVDLKGHEVFYICAPDTAVDKPSRDLAAQYCPNVEIRGDFSGHHSFFDSSKAGRLLNWSHPPGR